MTLIFLVKTSVRGRTATNGRTFSYFAANFSKLCGRLEILSLCAFCLGGGRGGPAPDEAGRGGAFRVFARLEGSNFELSLFVLPVVLGEFWRGLLFRPPKVQGKTLQRRGIYFFNDLKIRGAILI